MGKSIVLELDGDWEVGFSATLAINSATSVPKSIPGKLPANTDFCQQLQQYWQEFRDLDAPSRIKSKLIIRHGSINDKVQACKQSGQVLSANLNHWLETEPFRKIADTLREELRDDEETRFSVRAGNDELEKIPWPEWKLFRRFAGIEPTLSPREFAVAPRCARAKPHPKVKILAIFGNSEGIDLKPDLEAIRQLPHVDPTFLIEPRSREINQQLWEQEWDIIFFAGHSATEENQGKFYLNAEESITVEDLWFGLKTAVKNGLQLAIFNSCDGLGLARQLNDPLIPFVIVMREAVPDRVAREYLHHFLKAFAGGESLHAAAREAREKLRGLRFFAEGSDFECPGATWLPVIYENPDAIAPKWSDLYQLAETGLISPKRWPLRQIMLTSLACTALVMGMRWLGFLQPLELNAYDRLMERRSPEGLDPRILIVEVSEGTNNRYSYPLPDRILSQLLQTIEASNPQAIGLSLLRYQPRGEGRKELIDNIENNPHLFLTCGFTNFDKNLAPPSDLSQRFVTEKTGFGDLLNDSKYGNEGTRRYLISYNPDNQPNVSACSTPWSFSFQLAQHYLQRRSLPKFSVNDRGLLQAGDRIIPPLPERFAAYSSLNGGYQMMLNYRANPQPAMQASVEEMLSGKIPRDRIEGKIVLIGDGNEIANTSERTPYGKLPHAWIQAHATGQLLSAAINNRPLIWALPQWGNWQWGDALWVLIWSMLGGTLSWGLKKKPLVLGLSLGGVLILFERICLFVLQAGGWLPLIPTVLALLATAFLVAIWKFPERFKFTQINRF